MRVTTWNIRGGGGARCDRIAARLRQEAPDVCLLTEFRTRPGEALKAALGLKGRSVETEPPPNQNGLILYSSCECEPWHCPAEMTPISGHRWLSAWLPEHDLYVLGVHIPNERERWNKTEFWSRVLAFAEEHASSRLIILGDFNTGVECDTEGVQFAHAEQFRALSELGFADAWRAVHGDRREYSWYSTNRGNGFRIDHCFLSPSLMPHLAGARFDHSVRNERLSDHSMLSVELAFATALPCPAS